MPSLFLSAPTCEPSCTRHGAGCAYRVAWSINPHMTVGSADPARAAAQHGAFVCALRRERAALTVLPFIHGAYDSIFAKDCAVLVDDERGRRALLATARHAERSCERPHRHRQLAAAGFAVHDGPRAPLEGGDVVMGDGFALLGTGFRSTAAAAPALADFLGMPVVCVELVDPELYHLDMAVSVLADGTTLVCADALTARSLAAVRALPCREVIAVSRAAALRFAVNLVELDGAVVTGSDSPEVASALHARGRRVVRVDLGEFHLAGGSAACLVSRVHDLRARTAAAVAA